MYDAEEFRKRAEYCIRQANDPRRLRPEKAELLRLAGVWLDLADDAERMKELLGDALSAAEVFDADAHMS